MSLFGSTATATTAAAFDLPHYVVIVGVTATGIRAYLDKASETYYVEVPRVFSRASLHLVLCDLARNGFELIPEDECPAEVFDDGSQRIYAVQTVRDFM